MPGEEKDKEITMDDSDVMPSESELDEMYARGKKQFEEEQAKRLKEKQK